MKLIRSNREYFCAVATLNREKLKEEVSERHIYNCTVNVMKAEIL